LRSLHSNQASAINHWAQVPISECTHRVGYRDNRDHGLITCLQARYDRANDIGWDQRSGGIVNKHQVIIIVQGG
jgi:hypothetical protein